MRGIRGGGPALLGLAIEDPERVLQVPGPVGRAQLVGPLGEEGAQERDVARTADTVAHGVEAQRHPAQAEAGEEVVGQGHHLDVEVGIGRPEGLHPELMVLAVAAVLGVLVAERRRHVPGLPGRHRVVLRVGPGDGRCSLRTERHQLAVARSSKTYISLPTTSLPAPMPRWNTSAYSRDRRDRPGRSRRPRPTRRNGRPFPPSAPIRARARRACPSGYGLVRPIRARVWARTIPGSQKAPHGSGVRLSCQGAGRYGSRRPRRDASTR